MNEKTSSSWVVLIIIASVLFLFLYGFAQTTNSANTGENASIEEIEIENFSFSGNTVFSGTPIDGVLDIPASYSFGQGTITETGSAYFTCYDDAWIFLQENYSDGTDGYYDFWEDIHYFTYPSTYDYELFKPIYIVGDDYAVNYIGSGAFENDVTITSVILPDSIISVQAEAFQYCSNLKEITFNDGLEIIGMFSFWGTGLKEITLPNSVYKLGGYSFFDCQSLKTLTIGEGLQTTTLGEFNNCYNLEVVYIYSKYDITNSFSSYYNIFSRCTSLESIFIYEENLEYYTTTEPWSYYNEYYKLFEI